MPASTLQRVAPFAGILFVVLFIVGFILPGEVPGGGDPDSDIVAFFEDSGKRVKLMAAGYFMTAAGLSLLLFITGLRERLGLAEAEPRNLSRLAFAAGVLVVAMLFLLVATTIAVPAGVTFQDEPVDAGVARFLVHMGFAAFLTPGMFAAIALIVATSLITLRTGILPQWSAWLGFIAAVVLLFGALFVTSLAFFIWVLVISGALLTRRPEPLEARTAT